MSLSDFSALVRYFLVLAFLVLSGLCMPGRAFQSVLFPPHPPLALREKGPVCGFFAFHFALFGTFGTSSHFSLPYPPPLFLFSLFFCVSCLLDNQQHLRTDTHHSAAVEFNRQNTRGIRFPSFFQRGDLFLLAITCVWRLHWSGRRGRGVVGRGRGVRL